MGEFIIEKRYNMAILSTIKKVMPYLKTATGYVLCRLSSQAVEMDDGTTLQESYDSLNSKINGKIPFGGQAIARNGASGANVVHANVTFDSPLKNADYRAVAILVSGGLNDYDANYDVNVSISKKTVSGFTIDIHRGTEAMLEANGTWILDYIVLPEPIG